MLDTVLGNTAKNYLEQLRKPKETQSCGPWGMSDQEFPIAEETIKLKQDGTKFVAQGAERFNSLHGGIASFDPLFPKKVPPLVVQFIGVQNAEGT